MFGEAKARLIALMSTSWDMEGAFDSVTPGVTLFAWERIGCLLYTSDAADE